MSFSDGMMAFNLEMPDRVPRTEFSAHYNWGLIKAVTGVEATEEDDEEKQQIASSAFAKAWNYDFMWKVRVGPDQLSKMHTQMGHANFAAGNVDFDNTVACPFEEPEDVLAFEPEKVYDRIDKKYWIREFEKQYQENRTAYPNAVNTTGIYITCMSGLIDIFGWDMLLLAAGVSSQGFGEVANRYTDFMLPYFESLAESDVPVVNIHDDIVWTSGAFLSPEWYRTYIFPNYKKMFAPLKEAKKKIIYTSDGNYTQFIDDIAGCGVNGMVLEPTTDMKYIAEKYGQTLSFIGNADTRVLLRGTKQDIYDEVKRCMDIGKSCPGFFMSVSNHIPANTPIDNALYYNEAYEKLSKR